MKSMKELKVFTSILLLLKIERNNPELPENEKAWCIRVFQRNKANNEQALCIYVCAICTHYMYRKRQRDGEN